MGLETTRRIHIAPQGYERERIYQPAIDYDADEVILLVTDGDDQAAECQEIVEEKLKDEQIKCTPEDCDIFDPDESIQIISDLIHQHRGDDVLVNISTGTKITAISGMIACMLNDATPYYVKAEDYGDEAVTTGVEDTLQLPAYPIDPPKKMHVEILDFLETREEEEDPANIRDLNEFVQENDFPIVQNLDRASAEDIYDVTGDKIIEPLAERGLISKLPVGGEKTLTLTDKGRKTLQFSRHILGSED